MADNVIPFRRPPKVKNPPKTRKPAKDPGRWPPATITFLVCLVLYLAVKSFSPWSPLTTTRHLAAGMGCPVARAVGMAGAHIGAAGYWRHLDPQATGIACPFAPAGTSAQ